MTLREPIWVSIELAEAIHQRQIAEHGGGEGIRDRGLLESALARPRQIFAYGSADTDMPALAAAYAFGLSRNHPFADGNKRIAAVTCELFLMLNGYRLLADNASLYPMFLGLASGNVSETEFADWLRANTRPERVSELSAAYS
jgi:death-on-curing protein